jgi:Ca-activated chloride channel family protein
VLLIEDLSGESFCIAGHDTEGSNTTAMITSFCPKLPKAKPSNLRLKVLLDCSGSMTGDSIVQARVALKHLFKQLNEEDSFTYTRFGSSIDRVTKKMTLAYSERIQSLLSTIDKTEADLGGTELDMAITDVFNINTNGKARNSPETTDSSDVLLITDGEVWNIENILASARISGHRVYTIGVGSAPAESLLRELAKGTGGSCEFVTPREDMRGAVDRILTRMRSAQEVRFGIKWNATEEKHKDHEWASTLPPQLIDGETVHLYARLPDKTEKPPILVCKTLVKEIEKEVSSAKPTSITWDTEGIVARLCAAAQISELTEGKADTKLSKALAVKYQLVTQHTNFFLVHERAEEGKATGLPKLQQVTQMQAARWAGHGSLQVNRSSVMMCMSLSAPLEDSKIGGDYGRLDTPSVWRTNRTQVAARVDGMASAGMDDVEIPAFLLKQSDSINQHAQSSTTSPDAVEYVGSSDPSLFSQLSSKIKDLISPSTKRQPRELTNKVWPEEQTPSEATKVDIAIALNTAALHASSFRIALQHTLRLNMPGNYVTVIIDLTKVTKDSATSWALLLEWLYGDIEQSELLDRHAQRLLRSQLKQATEEMRNHAQILIESNLIIIN